MVGELKAFFDKRRVSMIADQLGAAWTPFPRANFVREAAAGLDDLELVGRGRHISATMARYLPQDYPSAIKIILDSLGPPLAQAEGNGMEPFHYLPHVIFVAERGLDHHDLSMAAQRELTRRFSCEFSIRAYLERDPERTLPVLARWAQDPDEHVRRLVSEGTRPRLPWAPRLKRFQADPSPVLALLEELKDDPSEYVRRSVANNLNDISKDHPATVTKVCRQWLIGASPQRRALIQHALRTLVRSGHPDAIRLAGGDTGSSLVASGAALPARARIGEQIQIVVELRNNGQTPATAVLSLRVHFVKARSGTSPKSFRLPTVTIAAGGAATLRKTISLRQHTTRTHYPGEHAVDLVVNGEAKPFALFTLVDAKRASGKAKTR
jgi:3-methyladenine DNA glycosylase AlkC